MKRTKEAYFRPNPSHAETQQSSGLTFLIGEDEPYYERNKHFQNMQREFLDEQIEEKKRIQNNTKTTNQMFDQQLLQNTHHRGQLEMEKHQRLHQMERAHDCDNLQMANERKERERLEK